MGQPRGIAGRMLDRDAPRTCEALRAAVLQLDMVGFTTMSEKLSPMEVRTGRYCHYAACGVLYSNCKAYIALVLWYCFRTESPPSG